MCFSEGNRGRTTLREGRPAVGTVVVVLAVVVILVVAGITVLLGGGLSGSKTSESTATEPGLVLVDGSLSAPSGSGNGNLTVRVLNPNAGNLPVVAVSFSSSGSTSISNVGSLVLLYQGQPVSASNPLPGGATACNSIAVQNVAVGDVYAIAVNVTLQGGSQQHLTLEATGETAASSC